MERLTIDEAIKHANEVAERNRKAYKNCPAELETKGYTCEKCADEHEQLAEWLEELKNYKDAEEQGLLLILPVPIGSKVYKIKEFVFDDEETIDGCRYKTLEILELPMGYLDIHRLGKTVFATKEEAEQALAKMKEGV